MIAPPILSKGVNKLLASASLRSDARQLLEISLSRTHLPAGAVIFDQGIDRVLFIEKGIAGETIVTSDGDPLGISIIGREGAVGLRRMGAGAVGFQVRALTAVDAFQINARALSLACARNAELESLLQDYSQTLLSDSILALLCHYHHDLGERLPRWLLMAADRLGLNRLPLTQEILAETLGVTQGAISQVLDALHSKGLVEHTRKEIIILDRRRLRSKACPCYPAVDRQEKRIVDSRDFGASLCST